jgi:hypothetical protein
VIDDVHLAPRLLHHVRRELDARPHGPASFVLVGSRPGLLTATALAAFETAYGLPPGQTYLLGPYDGKLDNGGERVALERPQAPDVEGDSLSWVIVDEVIYNQKGNVVTFQILKRTPPEKAAT